MSAKSRWLTGVAILLAVLWLQAEIDRWRLHNDLSRVYLGQTLLSTVDAETGAPLAMEVSLPAASPERKFPKDLEIRSVANNLSKMEVYWIDVGDLSVGVSAKGYRSVSVVLNQKSRGEIVVPLQRNDSGD